MSLLLNHHSFRQTESVISLFKGQEARRLSQYWINLMVDPSLVILGGLGASFRDIQNALSLSIPQRSLHSQKVIKSINQFLKMHRQAALKVSEFDIIDLLLWAVQGMMCQSQLSINTQQKGCSNRVETRLELLKIPQIQGVWGPRRSIQSRLISPVLIPKIWNY